MNYIESSKSYTGTELETVFFKPMLTGESVEELGIKVLYNMPIPTTVHLWAAKGNIMKSHTASTNGWSSPESGVRQSKQIEMKRVKAEMGFSAADYYSLVFENLAVNSDLNLDDLTGTELERVETELFRKSIAESIRATFWCGDTSRTSGLYNTFDGVIPQLIAILIDDESLPRTEYSSSDFKTSPSDVIDLFDDMWESASDALRGAKSDGQLVYFVTSDVYEAYEKALDSMAGDASYTDSINGRRTLMYHGIQVVDMHIGEYLDECDLLQSFAVLTDRRNLVMAVNTKDIPGSEIRMWYNPDEMENRQRAIFAAGCTLLDEKMISFAMSE